MKSLIYEVNAAIDPGLWDTLRVVEERILLLRQMADRATGRQSSAHLAMLPNASNKRMQPVGA